MNCKRTLALVVTMGILLLGASQVTGQQDEPRSPLGTYGSAFTYQGQLRDAGGPVNATCDLQFKLWDAAAVVAQARSPPGRPPLPPGSAPAPGTPPPQSPAAP